MKMKVKALAAALTLVAAAQANAAINDDSANNIGTGLGNGELFLSVIDRGGSSPESYVRDLGNLGLTKDILSNPSLLAGTSIGPDSNLSDLLTNQQQNGGSLYWQLTGINNSGSPLNVGALTTSLADLTSSPVPQGFTGFTAPFNNVHNYVSSVNATADPANPTLYSANNSLVVPSSNTGAFYDGLNFGSNWLDPVNSEAAIGQSMGFYYVQLTSSTTTGVTPFSDQWTLGADGTLTYGQPTPTPLPPAVWLLGSALVGLVGVGRRRTTAAV